VNPGDHAHHRIVGRAMHKNQTISVIPISAIDAPVRVLAILIVFLTVIRVPAVFVLGYWFLLQLLGGLP
jgi:hypothetical protein